MSFFETIIATLRQDTNLPEESAYELATEINKLLEHQVGSTSIPNSFIRQEIGASAPVIQIMLAQSNSSIQYSVTKIIQTFWFPKLLNEQTWNSHH